MGRPSSFEEISNLIVEAIIDEPIFSKEKIKSRIKAILKAWNLKISSIPDIENEDTATEKHKRLLHIQKKEKEIMFWKGKCQEHFPEKINEFYNELDKLL